MLPSAFLIIRDIKRHRRDTTIAIVIITQFTDFIRAFLQVIELHIPWMPLLKHLLINIFQKPLRLDHYSGVTVATGSMRRHNTQLSYFALGFQAFCLSGSWRRCFLHKEVNYVVAAELPIGCLCFELVGFLLPWLPLVFLVYCIEVDFEWIKRAALVWGITAFFEGWGVVVWLAFNRNCLVVPLHRLDLLLLHSFHYWLILVKILPFGHLTRSNRRTKVEILGSATLESEYSTIIWREGHTWACWTQKLLCINLKALYLLLLYFNLVLRILGWHWEGELWLLI